MNIEVPTAEEQKKNKRQNIQRFAGGLIAGVVIFALLSFRVFWWGLEDVEWYTWLALGFGALSFGFLSMWFGSEFWQRLFGR